MTSPSDVTSHSEEPAEGPAGESVGTERVPSEGTMIQEALLPRAAPRVAGYDVAGGTAVEPACPGATVWLSFSLAGDRTALAAVTAEGSGAPPGLALAIVRAFLVEFGRTSESPAAVLAALNDALSRTALDGDSQRVACGLLVPGPDGVDWACAGPVHGGVIRRAGAFEALSSHGPPLGMLAGFHYGADTLALGPGDQVLVLTGASDGLFRGAADLVASLTGKLAGEVVSTVHRAIRKAREETSPIETSVLYLRRR